MPHLDPGHESARNTLRAVGMILLGAGGLLAVIGLARFVSLFGGDPFAVESSNPAVSVLMIGGGGILAAVGFQLLAFGYAGRIMRYGLGETLPPTLDAARAASPVARGVARDIAGGIREAMSDDFPANGLTTRHSCGTENNPNARFCQGCGEALPVPTLAFCTKCGGALGPRSAYCPTCGVPTQPEREV